MLSWLSRLSQSKDRWTLKEYQPKDSAELWFFRKNLSRNVPVRHPDYSHLAYLTFGYSPRDASGLPADADENALFRIESDELGPLLADRLSIHIGSVTKAGVKDLLFHTRDPQEFLRRATHFRESYTQFRVECQVTADPQWKQYDDFP